MVVQTGLGNVRLERMKNLMKKMIMVMMMTMSDVAVCRGTE